MKYKLYFSRLFISSKCYCFLKHTHYKQAAAKKMLIHHYKGTYSFLSLKVVFKCGLCVNSVVTE